MTKESKNPQSQAKNPTSKGKKAGSSKGIKLNKVPDRASKAEPEIRNGNFWSMTIRPEMGRVQIGVDLRYVYLMIGNHGPGTIAITKVLAGTISCRTMCRLCERTAISKSNVLTKNRRSLTSNSTLYRTSE
jgi:hypothetical protein